MTKKFSERIGFSEVESRLQREGMNETLRNSIWNALDVTIWSKDGFLNWTNGHYAPRINSFSQNLWFHYFKLPIDTRPSDEQRILKEIRQYFFACLWYEVYDFVEFIIGMYRNPPDHLVETLNFVLERELAAFRIIEGIIVPVTDEQEIVLLKEALADTRYEGVTGHLKRALELLSDRTTPDYRNSIKESISAVESIAKIVVGSDDATLGQALAELGKRNKLHPALKQGFSKLYGYTSDQQGIRHAMLEEPNLSPADAKYFLLSCTSFVNYLKSQI